MLFLLVFPIQAQFYPVTALIWQNGDFYTNVMCNRVIVKYQCFSISLMLKSLPWTSLQLKIFPLKKYFPISRSVFLHNIYMYKLYFYKENNVLLKTFARTPVWHVFLMTSPRNRLKGRDKCIQHPRVSLFPLQILPLLNRHRASKLILWLPLIYNEMFLKW